MDNETKNEHSYPPRKVYRSRRDRLVFGVCGGIAEYYNIESLWVRLIFIFLGITGAIGFILYVALALLMPLDPAETGSDKIRLTAEDVRDRVKGLTNEIQSDKKLARRRNLLGLVIVIVGLISFLNELFPNFWIGWKVLWPLIIILIGLSIINNDK